MSVDKKQFEHYVSQFQFRELFNQMGWNNDRTKHAVVTDAKKYALEAVAEKSGFKIFVCSPPEGSPMPDYNTRKKIEGQLTKTFQEHLIIFIDTQKTAQIWFWTQRQEGKPVAVVETHWRKGQMPELLYQRVIGIFFDIDEEGNITIVDVTKRVADNFRQNNEKVTKKFYTDFKKEHTAFLSFITGIGEQTDQEWYASLMLNRLMFCYFIQKKGFLDNNKNYLRDKLNAYMKDDRGDNQFYSFYRRFLLVLFHKGLNDPVHSQELIKEIGQIPYLNGGLFDEHELEQKYNNINIKNEAFERLFDFFDRYEWHLDTRHTAGGRDINPDVIGYIFEKYINDRAQMGAYYTKEDITDYISKNCIIPFLFDRTAQKYPQPFGSNGEIWQMVKNSGDRYIYPAVKKGVELPLPEEIAVGLDTTQPNLLERRKEWNKPAPPEYALPTEIWREVVERRKRYDEVRTKIEQGEICHINDFITYNLNIRQLIQDVVENTNDAELLKHLYDTLCNITILDPTCGSGAFLFAAMNILEPIYQSCLMRMRSFVEDEDRRNIADRQQFTDKYRTFRRILAATQNEHHPNLQYFIFKSIILRNLYGVDLMKEAVEIAKLRLFLKLVATVEADYNKPNLGLEPLPDIDFNIRAGNALVGFATENELQKILVQTMEGQRAKAEIDEQCDMVARAFKRYKEIQLDAGDDFSQFKQAKEELSSRLRNLNKRLSYLLYEHYTTAQPYDTWETSHNPFHWLAEFYEIVKEKGGFDVVIGNPPYVSLSKITYMLTNYITISANNLYGLVQERSLSLSNTQAYNGFIVMQNISFSDDFKVLRKLIVEKCDKVLVSSFDNIPDGLFSSSGKENSQNTNKVVSQRVCIVICKYQDNIKYNKHVFTTKFLRWNKSYRNFLFELIEYCHEQMRKDLTNWIALNNNHSISIYEKLSSNISIAQYVSKYKSNYFLELGATPRYFISAVPFKLNRSGVIHLDFIDEISKNIAEMILNSNLFYWYWRAIGDGFHLTKQIILKFPIPSSLNNNTEALRDLSNLLKSNIDKCTTKKLNKGKIVFNVNYNKVSGLTDEIDKVLAKHYGFTEEELDFIINYDIKYRMGKDAESEEEE